MKFQLSTADSGRGNVLLLNTPNGNSAISEHDEERLPASFFPNKGRLQNAVRNSAEAVVKIVNDFNPSAAETKIKELSANPGLRQAANAFHGDLRKFSDESQEKIAIANSIPSANPVTAATDLATTSAYVALSSHAARIKFIASLRDGEAIPLARLPLAVLGLTAAEREKSLMSKVRRHNYINALKSPESNSNFTPDVTIGNLTPTGLDPEKIDFWIAHQQKDFDYRASLVKRAEDYFRNVVAFYSVLFSKNATEAQEYFLPKAD